MIDNETRIYAERSDMGRCINVFVTQVDSSGKVVSIAEPLTMNNVVPIGEHLPVSLKLNKNEAQFMLDSLWFCGVRPSGGEGNVGQLGATERHLEDMRKLVFKKTDGAV